MRALLEADVVAESTGIWAPADIASKKTLTIGTKNRRSIHVFSIGVLNPAELIFTLLRDRDRKQYSPEVTV